MALLLIEMLLMLLVILASSELFTNALEHLGERLKISEGVTGSVFAAVATALPETMVPLLAIFSGTANVQVNEEIGVGSILGAPLMLSTLSTCLMALSVLRQRGLAGRIRPELAGFRRDLHFFLFAFAMAALAMYVPPAMRSGRIVLSTVLVLTYLVYVAVTIRASAALVGEGHGTEAEEKMLLARVGLPENMLTIFLQLGLGLILLIGGAKGFIHGIEGVSQQIGVSALLLSLLIIPIATELPEKINSILWIRRGKDTLAFGNITGAMVFQGTLLPAIGIMLTPWSPRPEVLAGVGVTLGAAVWMRLFSRPAGLPVGALLLNGGLYAGYIIAMLA
jgi:cation:H+ antiporter